jgi:rubrerythrin
LDISLLEALKKARGIEEQLSRRYSQFAEFTDNEVARSLFTHLASECRKHSGILDGLPGLLGNAVNLNYGGEYMPGKLPEIGPIIGKPKVIETTFEIAKEHIAVEESVLRYYVDLSRIVTNGEASGIIRRLIEDERSHHELLGRLTSDLMELYGEQLALDSDI